MSVIAAMGVMAGLFVLFGIVRPTGECSADGGCAGCGAACHRRPSHREDSR